MKTKLLYNHEELHMLQTVFKRNARAVSPNAIVDVRRRRLRRHEMIFLNFSETTIFSNFKIYRNVAKDSFYIATGNDTINYFALVSEISI